MIERYVRTTCDLGPITIEPGIWWEQGDDCKAIRAALRSMATIVQHVPGDPMDVAVAFGDLIRDKWPSRFYFVEVFGPDGEWSQEYLPYGPRPRRVR